MRPRPQFLPRARRSRTLHPAGAWHTTTTMRCIEPPADWNRDSDLPKELLPVPSQPLSGQPRLLVLLSPSAAVHSTGYRRLQSDDPGVLTVMNRSLYADLANRARRRCVEYTICQCYLPRVFTPIIPVNLPKLPTWLLCRGSIESAWQHIVLNTSYDTSMSEAAMITLQFAN